MLRGKVKYISIDGMIQVNSETEHQEFLNKLYHFLSNEGYHFKGTTKLEGVKDNDNDRRSDEETWEPGIFHD